MDKKTNRGYNLILGRYLLTTMGLDLKFSENIIIVCVVSYVIVYMIVMKNKSSA